jgi:flagellar hook-length control protein FliK
MTELNVSEEQLNNAMEALGMTEENLLNPMELPLLLMKLEGVENQGDMLTNQDFAKDLRSIMQALEDIKENVNTQVEELDTKLYEENVETVDESLVDAKDDQSSKAENDISDDAASEVPKMEEANQSDDAQMTGNESNADDNDGLLQRKEVADTEIHDDLNLDKQLLTPQDFAARLTEDLTQKVGETKANDIVRQVIEQAQVQIKQNVTSMEMQLYPEHLGKVLIQVSTHDGHVTAQITAESEAAKTAMETQLTLLKDNLNNQGLKIEHIEVTIASHAFEQNMQGERGNDEQAAQSRKSRRNIGNIYGEADEEMLAEEQQKIMEITGSTVSYSA